MEALLNYNKCFKLRYAQFTQFSRPEPNSFIGF